YINKTGQIVIAPKFDEANSFSEGLADVKIDGKWGYINKTGQIVIAPKFDEANSFSEGRAYVKTTSYGSSSYLPFPGRAWERDQYSPRSPTINGGGGGGGGGGSGVVALLKCKAAPHTRHSRYKAKSGVWAKKKANQK
ncbi:MAG: WG repeat-containing protein, partial [Hormoscilla sp. SP5CHS1]|nr:WG repeat-containing protein [Hormoscilla sp. SP5CHS1]